MPRIRSLNRVLPDGSETREYKDLSDPGLAAHVGKHILTAEEDWSTRLGTEIPIPADPEAVRQAVRLAQAGEALENVRARLRELWGDDGERVLERLFCEKELSALRGKSGAGAREILRLLSEAPSQSQWGSTKGLGPAEIVESARRSGILPILTSAIVHLDLTDRLLLETDPGDYARDVVGEARKLMSRQGLFCSFLTTWVMAPDNAVATIRAAFGDRYPEIAAAYLDAAHRAAASAGATPRHCTYDLSSGIFLVEGVEGYVDDAGLAVVIGPDGSGRHRLYTAHVPSKAKSRGGELGAANRALLRKAWGPSTPEERKRFLEELNKGHVVLHDLHALERWRELR